MPSRSCFLTAALLLGACSTLPERGFPPFCDHDFAAHCTVPADGRLPMPQSRPGLTVHDLAAVPPPVAEQYTEDGNRYWFWAPGTHVHIACRCRAYADAQGTIPSAADLLQSPPTQVRTPHE
jgi:hypothetical protein